MVRESCKRCGGFLLVEDYEITCVNCGHVSYVERPEHPRSRYTDNSPRCNKCNLVKSITQEATGYCADCAILIILIDCENCGRERVPQSSYGKFCMSCQRAAKRLTRAKLKPSKRKCRYCNKDISVGRIKVCDECKDSKAVRSRVVAKDIRIDCERCGRKNQSKSIERSLCMDCGRQVKNELRKPKKVEVLSVKEGVLSGFTAIRNGGIRI